MYNGRKDSYQNYFRNIRDTKSGAQLFIYKSKANNLTAYKTFYKSLLYKNLLEKMAKQKQTPANFFKVNNSSKCISLNKSNIAHRTNSFDYLSSPLKKLIFKWNKSARTIELIEPQQKHITTLNLQRNDTYNFVRTSSISNPHKGSTISACKNKCALKYKKRYSQSIARLNLMKLKCRQLIFVYRRSQHRNSINKLISQRQPILRTSYSFY